MTLQVTLHYLYINCIHIFCPGFPALLITGGRWGLSRKQAYVISPTIGYKVNCPIPCLHRDGHRWHHTINNWTICGGGGYTPSKSCVTLTSGMWKETHNLIVPRYSNIQIANIEISKSYSQFKGENTAVGQSMIRLSYLGEETHLIMDQLKL